MSYNQKQHLTDNIEAIRLAFELEKSRKKATPEQQTIFRKYCGFGGLKCILNPCSSPNDLQKRTKSDAPLFPPVQRLYQVVRDCSENEQLNKQYVDCLQSSILTAYYTPPEIVSVIACQLAKHGAVAERFLDPSAGTGVFISAFKETGTKENVCFENDMITGKILKALHPNDNVHIAGFETMNSRYTGYFDVISSNIPFGSFRVFDTTVMSTLICRKKF